MRMGIVGHEAAKFLPGTEQVARTLITNLLSAARAVYPEFVCVSGRSPLGGIDVWVEEIADALGIRTEIYAPKHNEWETGFKPRNELIAQASHVVHVIVVDAVPPGFKGRQFPFCYHCKRFGDVQDHVKSGACWTARRALALGQRKAVWHVLQNTGA